MSELNLKPITLTVNDTLKIVGCGRTMLYSMIKEGKIKTILIGRRRLVVFASLEELANGK